MTIVIDDERRPILLVRFEGSSTDAEFEAYLAAMLRLGIDRKEKTVTIFDSRVDTTSTAKQRKMQADWLATHREALKRYSLGSAFVIPSTLLRGALTAILWLQPLHAPYVVVSTLEEAETWVAARLREAGLSAPKGSK